MPFRTSRPSLLCWTGTTPRAPSGLSGRIEHRRLLRTCTDGGVVDGSQRGLRSEPDLASNISLGPLLRTTLLILSRFDRV
ncbi:hypothetical protein NDU88_005991 [Pleurodeles waltl]|uniref:Uncharacterized protein n=1 Tax=Pleurodeles waltl TaxID=8319 RepID=A0AAV7WZV9_PLEWA|nr:hypothetical protein NDU88_005991 [Pleurodeles waltl]